MSTSTWDFSQEFTVQFQTSCNDLLSRLESAKSTSVVTPDVLEIISAELIRLTKSLTAATGSLPSYDQRQFESQLRALENTYGELRDASKPKLKFAFKRSIAKTSPGPTTLAKPATPTPDLIPPSKTLDGTPSANLSLSSHARCYLTHDSLPSSLLSSHYSDLTISELNKCIVNLLPVHTIGSQSEPDFNESQPDGHLDISAIHIRKLTDCVLLLPHIKGSVILHDLLRCIVVVGCHQFRMHTSMNTNVYLSCTSNPIIENSSKIRFTQYPAALSIQTSDEQPNHLSVQDFSHIRSTPSPHWSLLSNNDPDKEWPLVHVATEKLDETLERLLPSPGAVADIG